jgi:hypothetical protein
MQKNNKAKDEPTEAPELDKESIARAYIAHLEQEKQDKLKEIAERIEDILRSNGVTKGYEVIQSCELPGRPALRVMEYLYYLPEQK